MAGIILTEEQHRSLDEVARIDEWDREQLERIVLNKMWDGLSFKRAVMKALAEAPRPDDNPPVEQKLDTETRDNMIDRIERLRKEAADRYAASQNKIISSSR